MLKIYNFLFLILLILPCIIKAQEISSKDIKADEVYYDETRDLIIASGNVFIQMNGYIVNADKIIYDMNNDLLVAEKDIQITDPSGRIIRGSQAIFKDNLKLGVIKNFIAFFDRDSILMSRLAERISQDKFILEKSVFTPCKSHYGKKPIWQINAARTEIDYRNEKIIYKSVFFEVYGVPIIYFPYFSHPSPNAKEKSGILVPRIFNDALKIPFYFRIKSNMDLTLSPRLASDYTIFDSEFRHKVKDGSYRVNISYGNIDLKKGDTDYKSNRYFINAAGNFSRGRINYGFDIQQTSDKAFLTNYQNNYSPYLTSRLYTERIDNRNYLLLEGYYFQDLRGEESKTKTPTIFPSIKTYNVIDLSNDETTLLNIKNNMIIYAIPSRQQILRTALEVDVTKNLITQGGHVYNFGILNRMDLYLVNQKQSASQNYNYETLYRNIPEISAKWQYPLSRPVGRKSTIKIEPTVMLVVGKNYKQSYKKFDLIDTEKYELSENNLFSTNRFSGVDYHDYGQRLSYGINTTLGKDDLYIDSFIGQLLYKNNIDQQNNAEYVGNIRVDILNAMSTFYSFRYDKKFKPIRREIGLDFLSKNLKGALSFAQINQLSRYFLDKNTAIDSNKISQMHIDSDYRISEHLWIGGELRLDVTKSKPKVLVRSIRMTYLFDCVSINAAIIDNFLNDNLRGIKKTRNKSVTLGLKVLNM